MCKNLAVVPLPNAHLAVVDVGKVRDYLLNGSHPDNGGKAEFFLRLGYTREAPETLAGALKLIAVSGVVVSAAGSTHGEKFVVDGGLPAQTGKSVDRAVRTVWIVDLGDEVPRLVTAYPARM